MKQREYPWKRIRKGESFFVPALDVHAVMLEGVREARKQGVGRGTGVPGIYRGLLGVMFSIRHRR